MASNAYVERSRRSEALLVALAALAVVGGLVYVLAPGFSGWYHDDDFKNLRWTLEFRDAPWKALTERHALHDHVRPLTLLALWAGAWVADGEFWGQHAIQAVLAVLAVLGVVALGRDLSGRWLGGVTSALFAVSLPGFERMMGWTAWICSAGEVCCGIWSLVAARRAFERPVWLLAAVPLTVAAGLFKESGGLVYPAAALVMAVSAWKAKRAGQILVGCALIVLAGAATVAFTWHPANVARLGGAEGGLLERVQPGLVLSAWPAWGQLGAGVPVLVFVIALLSSLRGPGVGSGRGWALGGVAVAVAGYLAPQVLLVAVAPMALLALFAGRQTQATAPLALFLANLAILLPFPMFQGIEVSLLGGGFGLALFAGVGSIALLDHGEWWAPGLVRCAVGLQVVLLAVRVAQPVERGSFDRQRERKETTFALGALAQDLAVREATLAGLAHDIARIMPLFGVSVREDGRGGGRTGTVVVERALVLDADPARIQGLVDTNLIQTSATIGAERASVAVTEGYHVLGVVRTPGGGGDSRVRARDACDNAWEVSEPRSATLLLAAQPMFVREACGPLEVTWSGTGAPLLARLSPPRTSLSSDVEVPRLLDVKPVASPEVRSNAPRGGRGQRPPRRP